MVNVKNMYPNEFRHYIKNREIVIFGAGKALDSVIDLYFETATILFVVDNNSELWGTRHSFLGKDYAIMSPDSLVQAYSNNKRIICFIDSPFYAIDILKQLDSIDNLDGMECYIHLIMRNSVEQANSFEFTRGKQLIPKKIHYFWVGGNELPDKFKVNIDSWKEKNPEYEIIQWDESNYDFCQDKYTLQAYKSKQWGFVPNIARLKVIYQFGGIYLDTDVKAIASMDSLLCDLAFFNMGNADTVNRGSGFGAVKGAKVIEEMLAEYEGVEFCNETGKPLKIQDHMYCHPVLKKRGFRLDNTYQKKDGVVLYPSEVMSPLTITGMKNNITPKTISIHEKAGSWKSESEQRDNTYELSAILERMQH